MPIETVDQPFNEPASCAWPAEPEASGDDAAEDPEEVQAAWAEEIRLRVEEIRNGTAELYDLDDVLAQMEERYG